MPTKEFLCKKCGDVHKRLINCPFATSVDNELNLSQVDQLPPSEDLTSQASGMDLKMQILAELKSLGSRMTAMEKKMSDTSPEEVNQRSKVSQAAGVAVNNPSTTPLEEVVIPSVTSLQGTPHIQAEVDRRLKHFAELNEAGKLKSQRGGSDMVWVKKQVPWPQNFVLGGTNLECRMTTLLYISKCVKSSRNFLNRMLDTLTRHFGTDSISLDIDFHRDLNWFKNFSKKFRSLPCTGYH